MMVPLDTVALVAVTAWAIIATRYMLWYRTAWTIALQDHEEELQRPTGNTPPSPRGRFLCGSRRR